MADGEVTWEMLRARIAGSLNVPEQQIGWDDVGEGLGTPKIDGKATFFLSRIIDSCAAKGRPIYDIATGKMPYLARRNRGTVTQWYKLMEIVEKVEHAKPPGNK